VTEVGKAHPACFRAVAPEVKGHAVRGRDAAAKHKSSVGERPAAPVQLTRRCNPAEPEGRAVKISGKERRTVSRE